jgi:hypothetical protein
MKGTYEQEQLVGAKMPNQLLVKAQSPIVTDYSDMSISKKENSQIL